MKLYPSVNGLCSTAENEAKNLGQKESVLISSLLCFPFAFA